MDNKLHQQPRSTRVRYWSVVLSIVLAFGMAPQSVRAQEAPVSISILAQSLDIALEQLGEQTGLQIFYLPETVRGLDAPNISGSLTADQALRRLLSDRHRVSSNGKECIAFATSIGGDDATGAGHCDRQAGPGDGNWPGLWLCRHA